MHKFLRAIGFSDITKKDLEMILDEVITRPEIMKITKDSEGNEFDSKIEKMDEMEKSVGAVKGYVKVLSWFSIINFVMLVAFILYSLGVFNF